MKKLAIMLLISTLLITGCKAENTSKDDKEINTTSEISVENAEEMNTQEAEIDKPGMEVFTLLPDEFTFSSGAGGWGTELFLEDDGTFYGQYHDSDMGDIGDDYPNGTKYVCNFEGKFSMPEQVNDFTYSTTIEYMNINREGEEYIENGVRYIVTEPYGLENAEEILFYFYGISVQELPEVFNSWYTAMTIGAEKMNWYGLYNVNADTAFLGAKLEGYRELCKLGGSYVNEAGDEIIINLSSGLDEYSFDLGTVEWAPHGEARETGIIRKNRNGGFTICLEGSILYDFKMTNYEMGKIEFSGADKWSESFGTFVMQ